MDSPDPSTVPSTVREVATRIDLAGFGATMAALLVFLLSFLRPVSHRNLVRLPLSGCDTK